MKKEFKYIKNVPIELLLPHEQIQSHIVNYWDDMYINKSFIPAVAVSDQKIIIDGHHRVEMCKKNGIKIINVCQFEYLNPNLILKGGKNIIKNEIIFNAEIGELYTSKTTKHYVNDEGGLKEIFEYQKKYSLF